MIAARGRVYPPTPDRHDPTIPSRDLADPLPRRPHRRGRNRQPNPRCQRHQGRLGRPPRLRRRIHDDGPARQRPIHRSWPRRRPKRSRSGPPGRPQGRSLRRDFHRSLRRPTPLRRRHGQPDRGGRKSSERAQARRSQACAGTARSHHDQGRRERGRPPRPGSRHQILPPRLDDPPQALPDRNGRMEPFPCRPRQQCRRPGHAG